MLRSLCLAVAISLVSGSAPAQTAPAPAPHATQPKPKKKAARKEGAPADAAATDPASADPAAAAPAEHAQGPAPVEHVPAQEPARAPAAEVPPKPVEPAAKPVPAFDSEEFRRQVMEEVRKELQKTRDEVKQETAWVEQDSQARVQDSEAVESLKQRVNLFQPHGYFRMRGEFFSNMNLGRGADPSGYSLFPGPFIGSPTGNSQSDANMRFRFAPTLEVSEDLSIHFQADIFDNILLGSNPITDAYLDPYTPVAALASNRAGSIVNLKRVWGRVNTQLGEFMFGRMGYHWGLGILHNDGNCLDCDYGDTYDRVAFAPREFKGHHFTAMIDILDKGATSVGDRGELGRFVDLDTLDDGYRLALEITHVDTPDEIKRKLEAGEWVVNYGLLGDYHKQIWDTPTAPSGSSGLVLGVPGSTNPRSRVVERKASFYQPDWFLSLKKKKWRLDAEMAMTFGRVETHQYSDFDPLAIDTNVARALQTPITYLQFGGALQTDLALGGADAVLIGLEWGAASGDKGAYGFGARPWRSGSGNQQPTSPGEPAFKNAGPGDIDGNHLDFFYAGNTHARVNNFVFNRAFNVDMILFRNLITSVTSSWYLKPSLRWRPTGRKTGGGDDNGFELLVSAIYSQAWYEENTPSAKNKPLGLEFNAGITYDTSDRFHAGIAYGLLLPFSGLRNEFTNTSPSIAHAVRFITAIPF